VPPDLAFFETAKQEFNAFNTSSQVLMESISRLRGDNDKAHRQAQAALKLRSASPEDCFRLLNQEVIPLATKVADGLGKLEQLIQKNIQEDQRIVVVDAQGVLLGLVVDHVNQVLNVPKSLIDPPPQMGSSNSVELSGIAKLENGARLIMLLDSDKLFPEKTLQTLQQTTANAAQAAGKTSQSSNLQDTDKKGKNMAGEQQLVTFKLGNEEFGIPISQIQEIDRYSQITRVPRAPAFVDGVTNLRGEIIPVIDTRKRFGLEAKPADDHTRIIIVELAGTKTGLLVDSVSQVLNIAAQDIAPPPAAIGSGIDNEFIAGIGKVADGKRMIVLLNVEKILSRKEQGALAEISAGQ
jgi:purine-binding chemotaxis protein CheW